MKNNQQLHKILIVLFLVFFNGSFAQLLKQKDVYTVYINYPTYSVKASVSNSAQRIKVKESLTYYWYSSNKIMQTKGDYEGKVIDGPYTSFYLSNSLKEKGEFKNGLKNGKWISWYEDGKINEVTNWKNGERAGVYKKYNPDESLGLLYHYKHDKLNGEQVTYKNNKPDSTKKFRDGTEVIVKQQDSLKQKTGIQKKIDSLFKTKKEDQDKIKKENKGKTKTEIPGSKKKADKEEKGITEKKKKRSKTTPDKPVLSSEKKPENPQEIAK